MAGNPNPVGRKADKPIRDALLAALRQDPERIKRVAEKAWQQAEEGNMQTFKEIADRLDGKAVQPIAGADDHPPVGLSLLVEFVKSQGDDKAT
jgi:hypothetical protein